MNHNFEIITSPEYCLKAAITEVLAFKSGKKDIEEKEVRSLEYEIKKQEREPVRIYREIVEIRNQRFEVFEELGKEYNKKLSATFKKVEQMEEQVLYVRVMLEVT